MAQAGEWMLAQYDLGGPPPVGPVLWHERCITAIDASRPGFYAVFTPDGDHYVEELSFACADVADLKYLERSGATPAGVNPAHIYRFRVTPNAAERRQLCRDGALMLGQRPPPAVVAVQAPGGALPRGGAARPAFAAEIVRVVAEDLEQYSKGDVITELPDGTLTLGNKGLMPTASGEVVLLRSMPRSEVQGYVFADLRVKASGGTVPLRKRYP